MKIWEPKPPGTLWATPGLLTGLLYLFIIDMEFILCDVQGEFTFLRRH